MSDESKAFCCFAICACLVLCSLFWAVAFYESGVARDAIAAGLCEGPFPGTTSSHWIKPGN